MPVTMTRPLDSRIAATARWNAPPSALSPGARSAGASETAQSRQLRL